MPKIDVYKGNRIMIPVDEAKKAKAYRCPWTNKIYATKRDYVKHLKNLRETRMRFRARNIINNKIKNSLWNLKSFDDIIEWFTLHPEFLFDRILKKQSYSKKEHYEKYRNTFNIEITHLNLSWNPSCSNTHYSPHNGVSNWDGNKVLEDGTPAPRGYPGWFGHIEYKISDEMSNSSSIMKELRIHTGSGGARRSGRVHGYGVTFFADDWPELYKEYCRIWAEETIQDEPKSLRYIYGEAEYFKW